MLLLSTNRGYCGFRTRVSSLTLPTSHSPPPLWRYAISGGNQRDVVDELWWWCDEGRRSVDVVSVGVRGVWFGNGGGSWMELAVSSGIKGAKVIRGAWGRSGFIVLWRWSWSGDGATRGEKYSDSIFGNDYGRGWGWKEFSFFGVEWEPCVSKSEVGFIIELIIALVSAVVFFWVTKWLPHVIGDDEKV